MSRRKQAKPRAFKKEEWDSDMNETDGELDEKEEEKLKMLCANGISASSLHSRERFSKKLHFGRENDESSPQLFLSDISEFQKSCGPKSDDEESTASLESEVSVGGSSWDAASDGRGSLSPTSSVTPTSASETDVEAASTLGVTQNTPYQCSFCDKAFPRLSYLKRHEQTHADQLPFRCEYCGRHFKHKRSRDRHVKLHTGDKKYKCCHCEAAFSRSDHLKIHLKTHDTQKPFQCTVCNRGYNTAAALTAHMQNHKAKLTAHALNQLLKEVPIPPDAHTITQILKESQSTTDAAALSRFLQDKKLDSSLFPKINLKEFEKSSTPLSHSDSENIHRSTFKCYVCHVQCKSQNHLQRHLIRHNLDNKNPQERPSSKDPGLSNVSMGISSNNSTPSPRPVASVASPRPTLNHPLFSLCGKISCSYCAVEGFTSLEALQIHVQSTHGPTLNGDIRDPSSLLGFQSNLVSLNSSLLTPSLVSPLGIASSSRQIPCEICGTRVSGVAALQKHVITTHTFTDLLARTAEGVFCAHCLTTLSNPGALREHIKLYHSNPSSMPVILPKRPTSPPRDMPTDLSKKSRREPLNISSPSELDSTTLLCNQCNAPFNNFESFRTHLKSHLEGADAVSSQLTCPECNLLLNSDSALETHLSTHLIETSTEYGCQACLKLFMKPDELQKHLMDIHAHHLYRCALCKEMFDSKVSIQVHFAVKHSNECKIYKCLKCTLIFRSQAEFEIHVRVTHIRKGNLSAEFSSHHSSSGDYRCLLCPSILSSETELSIHMSTHQKQFQCSLCDEAFHVEFLLDKHMQSCHDSELNGNVQTENPKSHRNQYKKDFRCDICDAEFSSDGLLLAHRKQTHNVKGNLHISGNKVGTSSLSLFCAYCTEVCKSRSDLEMHMKTHQTVTGRHKCNICDELCPSSTMLAQHKLTHVKVISSSVCTVCRDPLTSPEQVQNHQLEHHPSPLPQPCVVCRQTLMADIEIKVHAKFHASQILPLSKDTFTVENNLSSTQDPSHSSSSSAVSSQQASPLHCSDCLSKWETKEEYDAHRLTHRNLSQTYQCIKCQESFASEIEIEAHVASHLLHEGSVHECHLCRLSFDTPLRLQCHLIEHTFEGCSSFTCYMCSSVFTTAGRLQQHMVEHGLGARPYDCHHCNLKFFFRAELENHLLTHSEAVNGTCTDCLSTFPDMAKHISRNKSTSAIQMCSYIASSSVDLQNHTLSHNSQPSSLPEYTTKDFHCETCGKKCRNGASLKIHQRTHDGAQPYICMNCGAGYSRHCEAIKHAISCDVREFKCAKCGQVEKNLTDLNEHISKEHSTTETLIVRPNSSCSSCDEYESPKSYELSLSGC